MWVRGNDLEGGFLPGTSSFRDETLISSPFRQMQGRAVASPSFLGRQKEGLIAYYFFLESTQSNMC